LPNIWDRDGIGNVLMSQEMERLLESTYRDRLPPEGVLRSVLLVSAALCASFGIVFGLVALLDPNLGAMQRIVLVAFLGVFTGVVLPWWLGRLAVKVEVDDSGLSVRLWPFRAVRVPHRRIERVESVTVDPLAEYGGWGIKGTADDQLFGMSGTAGVRVHYRDGEHARRLTILTSDTEALAVALGA
jgi:hypothetical protein